MSQLSVVSCRWSVVGGPLWVVGGRLLLAACRGVLLCSLFSVLCLLSSVLCPLSSTLCPLSSVLRPLSSALCPLSFAVEIDSEQQFSFAEQYFSDGEYLKAVGEYERFIYFFPEDERVTEARYKIGMSYFESKRFKSAVNTFTVLIDSIPDFQSSVFRLQSPITKAYFMISESYMKMNALSPAISNLRNLAVIAEDKDVKDEAFYRIGWFYLDAAFWEEARSYFGKISPENRDKYKLRKLSEELDKERLINKKVPAVAGFLSIIPGAGYLYCERYNDALTAFLVNGAMMYAAYECFDNGNDVLGGIITFVGTGFYTGNIYGSISSAHKYNRAGIRGFIEQLKKNTKVGLSVGRDNGILFSFKYFF
ncbi:tetratricopeptide repeat protein [Desulfobacterales bacterium HSG2]|nr:tetratricopeptide repeat protein [Desulfobacterales bacterium HSG2]